MRSKGSNSWGVIQYKNCRLVCVGIAIIKIRRSYILMWIYTWKTPFILKWGMFSSCRKKYHHRFGDIHCCGIDGCHLHCRVYEEVRSLEVDDGENVGNYCNGQHVDGSVQKRRNSIVDTLELRLSCTDQLMFVRISSPLPQSTLCSSLFSRLYQQQ